MIAVDSNILVYAFDSQHPKKQQECAALLQLIFAGKLHAVVSNQILGEFAYVATEKMKKRMSKTDAAAIVGAIADSRNWEILSYSPSTILATLQKKQHFWDSLIAATFQENNVKEIVTYNIKDFKNSGIRARKPAEILI